MLTMADLLAKDLILVDGEAGFTTLPDALPENQGMGVGGMDQVCWA